VAALEEVGGIAAATDRDEKWKRTNGEQATDDVAGGESELGHDYANTFMAILLGLAVVVRGGASDDEIRAQLDSTRAVLESWRSAC
jgi:hypothetical protein